MKYLLMCVPLLFVMGCGEEFAAGVATGAAAMETLSTDAQLDVIEAVNKLNAETERLNNATSEVGSAVVVKPGTLEAIESLKGREKDPVTWMALLSLLGNGVWAGRAIEKRIAK